MFIAAVIVTVFIALAAIASAGAKLSKNPKIVEQITGLGVPASWLPILGVLEIAGGVGVLVGLGVPALGIAAGIGLVLYFLGAVAAHLKAGDKAIVPPLVLAVIAAAAVALRIATM